MYSRAIPSKYGRPINSSQTCKVRHLHHRPLAVDGSHRQAKVNGEAAAVGEAVAVEDGDNTKYISKSVE